MSAGVNVEWCGPFDECTALSGTNLTMGKNVLHELYDVAKLRSTSSTTLITRSVWPSVSGWAVMDMSNRVPSNLKRSVQKTVVNRGSRSDTIEVNRPWCRYTMSTKVTAVWSAVVVQQPEQDVQSC